MAMLLAVTLKRDAGAEAIRRLVELGLKAKGNNFGRDQEICGVDSLDTPLRRSFYQ
jgi:hypothetical protein